MYYARNFANRIATGQAVPSVTPGYAARYLHKVECFCVTQQHLEPGEELDMPVYFYVGEDPAVGYRHAHALVHDVPRVVN